MKKGQHCHFYRGTLWKKDNIVTSIGAPYDKKDNIVASIGAPYDKKGQHCRFYRGTLW